MSFADLDHTALVVERQLTKMPEAERHAHQHLFGQFVLVKNGVLHGSVIEQRWLLKPGMAVWIPPQTLHSGEAYNPVDLTVLYLDSDLCKRISPSVKLIDASPLIIALCERLAEQGTRPLCEQRRACMLQLLFEEIEERVPSNMVLPLPRDARLKRVAEQLIARPGMRKSLTEWGREVGATERTLARLFRKDTGLRYTDWHNRLLLVEAYRGLAVEHSNETLAQHLGFASGDSFGHWFRRITGSSPGKVRSSLQAASA